MSLIKPVSLLRSIQKLSSPSNLHLVCSRVVLTTHSTQLSATASYCTLLSQRQGKRHTLTAEQALRIRSLTQTLRAFHTTIFQESEKSGADNSRGTSSKDGNNSAATTTEGAVTPDSEKSSEKTSCHVPSGHKVLELMDENNEPLGSVPRDEAITLSKERKLKLVLINPQSRPYPTYRLMSHEEFNKEHISIKEKLKKVKTIVKEVRISCGIGEHDLQVKKRHMKGWFDDAKHEVNVKVVVQGGKPRKKVTEEDQLALINRLMSGMEDHIIFNNKPKAVGKHNPNLVVQLRRMSNKEKAKYNKQKNMEQS